MTLLRFVGKLLTAAVVVVVGIASLAVVLCWPMWVGACKTPNECSVLGLGSFIGAVILIFLTGVVYGFLWEE